MKRYPIPAKECQTEITVINSRFIALAAPVFSAEQAREWINRVKAAYPDATHHVPAFLVGFGESVTAHCSDAGEPSGTAGRPILAVLQGSGLGDVGVVVVRYFGGTKLGTGGLVRAYGDATKEVLKILPRAEKVATYLTRFVTSYPLYERVKNLVIAHHGLVVDEEFTGEVRIDAQFIVDDFPGFQSAVFDLSRGVIRAEILSENPETIMPLSH
jgi:uncharacterized YigZ family protein